MPVNVGALRREFRRTVAQPFYVRFHLLVILSGVALAGFLTSKALFLLGVRSMLVRFVIAAVVAWAAFVLLARLWALYVTRGRGEPRIDLGLDLPLPSGRAGGHDVLVPGGGRFGGGGASGVVDGPSVPDAGVVEGVTEAGSQALSAAGHTAGMLADGDDLTVIPAVVLGGVLAAVVAVVSFVLFLSPLILLELAFQTALAAGLLRASATAEAGGRALAIARASVLPFAVILVTAAAVGGWADRSCPDAALLADVMRRCVGR